MPKHTPTIEPDEHIVALFGNANRCAELRKDEPPERTAELVEFLSSQAWARLVALVRSDAWERLEATIAALDVDAARTAVSWAVIELARLQEKESN